MTSMPRPLLISSVAAGAQHSFIVVCDDDALRRLSASFLALCQRTPFTIGDGSCVIIVEASGGRPAAMTRPAAGPVRWSLPAGAARRYGDLIAAMTKYRGPCHQYLEAASMPVVLISKGEYNPAAIRKMHETAA